jgi:hypothetical protein
MIKGKSFTSPGISILALLLATGTAHAVDPPPLKEGLWSIHRQTIDNPGNKKSESTSTICRSHAYDLHVESLSKAMKGCATSIKGDGGKFTSEAHCVVSGTKIDTTGTAAYQGDSGAHSESHATYTPAMAGITESAMIVDQKYVGSCPAGQQPGDMTTGDGHVVHLWKK